MSERNEAKERELASRVRAARKRWVYWKDPVSKSEWKNALSEWCAYRKETR